MRNGQERSDGVGQHIIRLELLPLQGILLPTPTLSDLGQSRIRRLTSKINILTERRWNMHGRRLDTFANPCRVTYRRPSLHSHLPSTDKPGVDERCLFVASVEQL